MQHCCKFSADDIYFLEDTNLYDTRRLYIGFCPICNKPVAELFQRNFTGDLVKESAVGIRANEMAHHYKDEILYSSTDFNYKKFKSKPFGWKYGVNKACKEKGKTVVKQFAYDFYGNKELIKTVR